MSKNKTLCKTWLQTVVPATKGFIDSFDELEHLNSIQVEYMLRQLERVKGMLDQITKMLQK